MDKHPDCEDRCQLREHKGYISCQLSGQCSWLEAEGIPYRAILKFNDETRIVNGIYYPQFAASSEAKEGEQK